MIYKKVLLVQKGAMMPERIGQQLGSYTILRLLGQGGFADVYLGEHIYLKSQAAIKVLQTRLSSAGDIDSFLREAQTIARLSHPNIIRVLDFGIAEETPFLVMDYAPNGTLRERHPRGTAVPLITIIPYVRQLADALQYAHDEHLIHRDIKPENMLLGRRNEVLLSDFGIALVAQSSRYQGTQDVIGTVAYMSPEQIQGKPRPASDQYSLAIVIYEWLSGERPFQGSFTELCTQHMFAAPPPLSEKLTRFSPEVEQVVMKALNKDPKLRYESIQLFAREFEQASQRAIDAAKTLQVSPQSIPPQSYATQFMPGLQDNPSQTQNADRDAPDAHTLLSTNPGTGSNPQAQSAQLNTPAAPLHTPPLQQQPPAVPKSPETFHSSQTVAQTRPEQPAPHGQFQNPPAQQPYQQNTPAQPIRQNPPFTPSAPANANPYAAQQGFAPPQAFQPPDPRQFQQQARAPFPPASQQQHSPAYGAPPQASPYRQPTPRPDTFESLERDYQPVPPPRRPEPPLREQNERAEPPREREPGEDFWGFLGELGPWKWRILAALIGIILVCALHNFRPYIPYGLRSTVSVVLVIPLFFGAAFGPWVGLSVGLGGLLLSNLFFTPEETLRQTLFGSAFSRTARLTYQLWLPYLFYALAGFAPGLTMLRRKYPSISSVIRAMLLSAILFACAIAFVLYNVNALRAFPAVGLVALVDIVIALVLLIIYSILVRLIDPRS